MAKDKYSLRYLPTFYNDLAHADPVIWYNTKELNGEGII